MIEAGTLSRLRLGDHACVVVDGEDARLQTLAAFIGAGIRDNDKVLYFGPGVEQLPADLAARGVDTHRAHDRGQLRMLTAEQSYLASGSFDPEATICGWRIETADARAAGYRGLRAIGDMSWAARPVPGAERLPWYEAQVNRVFADGDAMAICLYDQRLFSAAQLQRICCSHPAIVDQDTTADAEPLLRAIRTVNPPGIRLEGEADLSNRHALRAVMEHLVEDTAAGDEPVAVDVSGLHYADQSAIRTLMHTAVPGAHRVRVAGCSASMRRLLAFNGADTVTGLTVEPAA